MSRWMMPFWCARWMAWQTGVNNSNRSTMDSRCSSQERVRVLPRTSSITKNGRPPDVDPISRPLATLGWFIRARICRESVPGWMTLSATRRLTGSVCSVIQTVPMPPWRICSSSLYRPGRSPGFSLGTENEVSDGAGPPTVASSLPGSGSASPGSGALEGATGTSRPPWPPGACRSCAPGASQPRP